MTTATRPAAARRLHPTAQPTRLAPGDTVPAPASGSAAVAHPRAARALVLRRGTVLARELYLNAARDEDYARRSRTRQALHRWWQGATDTDRHAAYQVLRAAAGDYGIAVAD